MPKNFVKKLREGRLMSKTELARKAEVSPLTIARIEEGKKCRMETKRKIIFALGFRLEDKAKVFKNDDDDLIEGKMSGEEKSAGDRKAVGSSPPRKAKVKRGGGSSISDNIPYQRKERS